MTAVSYVLTLEVLVSKRISLTDSSVFPEKANHSFEYLCLENEFIKCRNEINRELNFYSLLEVFVKFFFSFD